MIRWSIAAVNSSRLCGGIFVAMPTAIPLAPLRSKFGSRAGNTSGCIRESSKLATIFTVFRSRSERSSEEIVASRASVYLIAAGGSPSTEPKFP